MSISHEDEDARRDAVVSLPRQVAGERIHRAEELEFSSVGRDLVAALANPPHTPYGVRAEGNESHVYATLGAEILDGTITRHVLDAAQNYSR